MTTAPTPLPRRRAGAPALAAAALALAALAGCVEDNRPRPVADACGATDLQYLVGQPERALQSQILPGPTRILRPGMAMTMDYSASRLNIFVDPVGIITRVYCG